MRPPYCQSDSNDATMRAHGCGIVSTLYLRRWASDGDVSPTDQPDIDKALRDLRNAAGMTMAEFLDRGTTSTELEKAFETRDFPGHLPPRMRLMLGGSVRSDLLPELTAGNLAAVAVDYGVIQDGGKGVTSFRGGHEVVVGDPDGDSLAVADPLRRELVRWPIALLERAMETFGTNPWGGGRGNAGVAYPSPTYREAYTGALRTIKRTEADLDKAQDKIVAARAQTTLAKEERDAAVAEAKLATAALGEIRPARDKFKADLAMVAAERDALTAGKAALVAELARTAEALAACEATPGADCSAVEMELAATRLTLATAEADRDVAQMTVERVRLALS